VFCWHAYFFTSKISSKMLTNHTSCHPNTQTPPPDTMACSSILGCHHIPINLEWIELLVGLQLIILNSWWPAYHDDVVLPPSTLTSHEQTTSKYSSMTMSISTGCSMRLFSFTWTAISLASQNSVFQQVVLAILTMKWCT
jgi:hypothetical protein